MRNKEKCDFWKKSYRFLQINRQKSPFLIENNYKFLNILYRSNKHDKCLGAFCSDNKHQHLIENNKQKEVI